MQYFDGIKYGQRIKKIREQRKITQEELATAVGYSDARQIQRIESGKSAGSIDKLMELAQTLDVSTDHLLYGSKESYVDRKIVEYLEGKTPAEQEFAYKLLQTMFDNKNLLVG